MLENKGDDNTEKNHELHALISVGEKDIFKSEDIVGYSDPITGLCQLLFEKGSECVHGVEEECEPGTKSCITKL